MDAAIIAAHYPEWLEPGAGARHYLSVPELPTDGDGGSFLMPGATSRTAIWPAIAPSRAIRMAG